jgi:hypothetical protein
MKILNPNYVPPADATAAAVKSKLAAWFAAHPNVPFLTFDQVATAAQEAGAMSQGAIHQAAKDGGFTVDTNG